MGSYIYGYTTQKKVLPIKDQDTTIEVGVVKYICKPHQLEKYMSPQASRMISRYRTLNENRTLNRYVVTEKFSPGSPIHDMTKRNPTDIGGAINSIFYDDPWGFGPVVGVVVKEKNRWTAIECDAKRADEIWSQYNQ